MQDSREREQQREPAAIRSSAGRDDQAERRQLLRVLAEQGGSFPKAARALGMSLDALRQSLWQHGIRDVL